MNGFRTKKQDVNVYGPVVINAVSIGIEKGFMPGGKSLRAMGVPVQSLAIVTGIEDGRLLLADD